MRNLVTELTSSGVRIITGEKSTGEEVVDVRALLEFYEKNKYPLITFKEGRNGNKFFSSAEYKNSREHHAMSFKLMREEYLLLRNQWAQYGIPCILIKSGGSFLPFPYTSDNLDILIHRQHESVAREVLLELGYVELKNLEEPRKFLFRKFRGGELVSDIHLHTRIGWGVGFMDDDSVWAGAQISEDDGAVMIPSPEDTILITLAHSLYENKKIRLADIIKIRECWKSDIDWQYMRNTTDRAGWFDGLCFGILLCTHLERVILGKVSLPRRILIECRKEIRKSRIICRYYLKLRRCFPVSLPFSISFVFSKYLFYRKILGDSREGRWQRYYQVVRTTLRGFRLKTKIRPQSPFLVTFSGIDGSGKTQHAQALEKCMKHYGLNVRYRWSRCASSGLTRLFSVCSQKLFWRQSTSTYDRRTTTTDRRRILNNPVLRFFWFSLAAFDMTISYFFTVRLPLLRGQIIVCDRYIYDAAAEMESSLSEIDTLNRILLKLMIMLSPRPNKSFFLSVPEKTSAERRDTNKDVEYIRRQRNAYMKIVDTYRLSVISTVRDFSDNADQELREVAVIYFKRYPTFINGLFLSNPAQLNPVQESSK